MEILFPFICNICGKKFKSVYENKGDGYYGNGQKYNFRAPAANFNKHLKACRKKHGKEYSINKTCIVCGKPITRCPYLMNKNGEAYHNNCEYDNKDAPNEPNNTKP